MDEITPFKKIPLHKYFQHDLEKIKMAYRLSDSIRTDLKNLRAAGDEIELSVKNFYKEKLFPKYHVCDGHIVDSSLKVSPQFDIIICENSKNPVLFNLADKSEIVFYETVYCFGEVKKSFYDKNIIKNFSQNIERSKAELKRERIARNFIETSTSGFHVEEPVTNLPYRNPILSFLFFVNSSAASFDDLNRFLSTSDNRNLPNFIVLLDAGIIVNVNENDFTNNKITINLYPEFEDKPNIWVLMDLQGENNVLTYQYMLILEHLNNVVVSPPDLREYTKNIFDFSISNFHKI
ncbi:MAG: hypothetical protein KF763_15260 [Cyclobacteriaceae bacterium]|nr:hypothetical protein [Cyclobacteriaceae bacterium]